MGTADRRRLATCKQPLVASWPWATDPWAAISSQGPVATRPQPLVTSSSVTRGRHPLVSGPGPAGDQQLFTGHGSTPSHVGLSPFF